MEGSLHGAIGAALAIETVKLQIRCANIRFRDKVHILATLVDVAPHLSDKDQIRKSLRELGDCGGVRNMIAHDVFRPDEAKTGVEFLIVKAKGKFDQPTVIWNADRFRREVDLVAQYKALLETLTRLMMKARDVAVAKALPPVQRRAKPRRTRACGDADAQRAPVELRRHQGCRCALPCAKIRPEIVTARHH